MFGEDKYLVSRGEKITEKEMSEIIWRNKYLVSGGGEE